MAAVFELTPAVTTAATVYSNLPAVVGLTGVTGVTVDAGVSDGVAVGVS